MASVRARSTTAATAADGGAAADDGDERHPDTPAESLRIKRRVVFLSALLASSFFAMLLLNSSVPQVMKPQSLSPPLPPPTLTIPSSSPALQSSSLRERCAPVRGDRLLVYAAHSGFGNQEFALRRALLVAYVTNRTLVLPPILRHSDLAFGVPEVRCRNSSWQSDLQMRAEALYERKLTAMLKAAARVGSTSDSSPPYESLLRAFDFDELTSLGLHVADYAQLPVRTRRALGSFPLPLLGCTRDHRYSAVSLREAFKPLHAEEVVRMGSAYFLHVDLDGLRRTDACFEAVYAAVLRLPWSSAIGRMHEATVRTLFDRTPFASVHLRLLDTDVRIGSEGGAPTTALATAEAAQRQMLRDVAWLQSRIVHRLTRGSRGAGASLFVATNAPGGVRSPLLSGLCKLFNCTDLAALEAGTGTTAKSSELLEGSSSWLSRGTVAMLVEQGVSAAAPRGFFATSKFCGPAGYRRSTFSEAIALRWALRYQPATPLCAHAMQHALIKGMAAHSTFVY